MKKLLIGCGVLAILLFCIVVGTGVWLFFKAKRYADELKAIQTSYIATNSAYPFMPPDPAILDARRVGDFLIVRAALLDVINAQMGQLDTLKQTASEQRPDSISFREIKSILTMPLALPKQLGTTHVAALEAKRMSLDEYLWHSKMITGTALAAAREGKQLTDTLREAYGRMATAAGLPPPPEGKLPDIAPLQSALQVADVPFHQENLAILEQHAQEISRTTPVLWMELILRNQPLGGTPAMPTEP
jgi:hypothetical protein